jgi:hypothetical protein
MADRSLKLLSKNHLNAWEYRWLYPFVMTQFLDEGLVSNGSSKSARKNTASVSAEHVAGVDDFEVAEATYRAAVARWPRARPVAGRAGRT